MPMILCEAAGARLIRFGVGRTQVTAAGTEDVLLDVSTWDASPAGPEGDVVYRSLAAEITHDGGYSVGVTPIVDGAEQAEQTFSGGAPSGGGTERATLQAFIAVRGNRIAARVRQLDDAGTLEVVSVTASASVIRGTP
jgi:hypothetical protein